jgi:hypothetical protein
VRYLFSLAMLLLTLNVSVAEALRACANKAEQKATHENCEKPAQQPVSATCCDAMASCSTTVAIDGAADEARVIPDRGAEIFARAAGPSALERAPEPPPPKGQA